MRKNFIVFLFAVMLFSLTACGNNSGTQKRSGSEPPAATQQATAPVEENKPDGNENESTEEPDSSVIANDEETQTDTESSKILIAYFSRVGNTDFDANVDAVSSATLNLINGELVGNNKIIADMIVDLTGGDLFLIQTDKTYPSNYRQTTDVAMDEKNADERPELSSHVENMDDYDIVILGYPNWWGTIPQALFTFLEEYDFSGKTIIPFATHEGSGLGSGVSDIKELCPDATVLDGLAVRGSNVTGAQEQVENWLDGFDILN